MSIRTAKASRHKSRIILRHNQQMTDRKTLFLCMSHVHVLNLTNSSSCQAVSVRNRVLWPGKWRSKPIHAATSPGIELWWLRPEQQLTDTAWSAVGNFCERPHSSFSSPPSLPQKHIYGLWLIGLIERFDVLKRFVVAKTDWDQRQCSGESALAIGVCSHLCPMTKWNKIWDAPWDRMISLAICVLLRKNQHVVLLTSKFQCEIMRKDLEIHPPRCYANE